MFVRSWIDGSSLSTGWQGFMDVGVSNAGVSVAWSRGVGSIFPAMPSEGVSSTVWVGLPWCTV